jgi:hypothetical protein
VREDVHHHVIVEARDRRPLCAVHAARSGEEMRRKLRVLRRIMWASAVRGCMRTRDTRTEKYGKWGTYRLPERVRVNGVRASRRGICPDGVNPRGRPLLRLALG